MKKINLFGENGILSGKRVFLFTCCSAVLLTGVTSVAASGNIKSQGVITYDNHTVDPSDDVFFDASDLTMLETEIQTATDAAVQGKNDLVDKLKEKLPSSVTDGLGDNPTYDEIADAIGNIGKGANFTADELLEGKIGYDGTNLVTGTMPNKGAFTSSGLLAGESVTIPKGFHNGSGFVQAASLASQTGVTGTYTNTHDTEDTSDDTVEDLVAATADNLSLGTAAWVDGQYIVGNGADNNSYYASGYSKGAADAINKTNIQYTYHSHENSCYKTCVVSSSTSNGKGNLGKCPGCDRGGNGELFDMKTTYYRHSICGKALSISQCYCGGCGIWFGQSASTSDISNHTVIACGKSNTTIESATIIFD